MCTASHVCLKLNHFLDIKSKDEASGWEAQGMSMYMNIVSFIKLFLSRG
jgi:hypothetical protein